MLYREARIMLQLAQTGSVLMPTPTFCGEETLPSGQRIYVIVMDLLGKNLKEIFFDFNQSFSLSTILRLAIMMVSSPQASLPSSPPLTEIAHVCTDQTCEATTLCWLRAPRHQALELCDRRCGRQRPTLLN